MRRIALLLGLATLLGGCSKEIDQSTRPENVVGTYTLLTYAGKTLPFVVRSDSVATLTLVAAELSVNSDHTWTETDHVRVTSIGSNQIQPFVSSGDWSLVSEQAYMIFNDRTAGYQFTGVAAGGSITLETVAGNQLVFRHD